MASQPLIDIAGIDLSKFEFGLDDLREVNPHRFEFEMLDGIIKFTREPLAILAIKRVRYGEWWCRGHIPGNPLFPGALMVEAAGQAASFCFHALYGKTEGMFFGFGGIDEVRFRGTVRPGDDLLLMVKAFQVRQRRAVFEMQGWVADRLVVEGKVIGVTLPTSMQSTSEAT